jgi:hypothetical protein
MQALANQRNGDYNLSDLSVLAKSLEKIIYTGYFLR